MCHFSHSLALEPTAVPPSVPLSRFTSRVGGGSASYVHPAGMNEQSTPQSSVPDAFANRVVVAALAFAWAPSSISAKGADTNMTPRLDISQANNLITLSWPSWAIYFKPWSTTNLSSPTTWSPVSNPITVTNAQCSLTLGISNNAYFFRLNESQASLAMGLIAHYTFDEQCTSSAPGCVQDTSGLGNNGTLGSATSGTLPQAPIWYHRTCWSLPLQRHRPAGRYHRHHRGGNIPAPRRGR